MGSPTRTIVRQAVRGLVVDARQRLLLIRCSDPKLENAPVFWITPGGGIEPGENPLETLARELHEEVGLTVTPGPCVWRRRHLFHFNGKHYDQSETFYFCPVTSHEVTFAGHTQDELMFLEDYHWWSLEELTQTTDKLAPSTLAQHLPALLRGEFPVEPIDVET